VNIEPHLSMASPATLADVLEQRLEEVIQRWTYQLRQGLAPGPRTRGELRDHIQDYLQQLVAALRQGRREVEDIPPSELSSAREHGKQRLHLGFDLQTLVREYGVLRECILDLVEETGVKVTLREVRTLTAFITTSIAEAVSEYVRQRDEATHLNEARLMALLDHAPAAIYAKDPEGRYLISNRYQQQILGHTREEVLGQDDYALLPREQAAELRANDALAMSGHTAEFEEVVRQDTGTRTFLSLKFPLPGADGHLAAIGGISTEITERKQAEAERARLLREAQEAHAQAERNLGLLDTLLRTAPVGLCFLDRELRYVRANQVLADINGVPLEQTEGRTLYEVVPQVAANLEPIYRRIFETGQPLLHLEVTAPAPGASGEMRHWLGNYNPVRNSEGEVILVSTAVMDITGLRHAEETVRETTQRLQAILETAVDGIITIDEQGHILSLNPATVRIFGYSPEELMGRDISMLMPQPYRREHASYMRNYLETGVRKVIGIGREVQGQRKDGSIFPLELSVSETVLPSGRFFTGIVRDISVRKTASRAQALLLEAGTLLSQSLDVPTTLESLASLAVNHLCDYCTVDLVGEDGQLQRLKVATRDAERRELVRQAMAYPPLLGSQSPLVQALETGQPLLVPEVTPAMMDATARGPEHRALLEALAPRAVIFMPLVARGRKLGLISLAWTRPRPTSLQEEVELARGIADRAAVAIDNARLYEEAQQAIRMREDVVAIVSHDLRNPLNAITLSAGVLLQRADVDERTTRTAARIASAAERGGRLIRDLLDFTQARVGGLPIHPRSMDVHELVQRVVEEVRLAYPERRIEHEASGEGHGEYDADRLAQVVTNLVGNALQHSPPGTPVRVATRGEPLGLHVVVHNQGRPIPEKLLPKLFEPYRRGPEAGEARGSLGLGLYITHQIVLGHGGSIEVRSTQEAGTTFTVHLPRSVH
jgi:PAS domain S-box-containing protein